MKKQTLIILSIIILVIIIYFACDFLCRIEVKCKNCPKVSQNIIEAKNNGVLIGVYESESKVIELKNYNEKITIRTIWVENAWIQNTDLCLCPKIEKIEGYNIILKFKKTQQDFIFNLMPITEDKFGKYSNGIHQNKKEMRFENLPNKLKIIVEERNPDKNVGWIKPIKTDTIVLNLKKNEL